MKRLKHSKFKNTSILFELLVRQMTSDILNDNQNNSKALPIIKRHFNNKAELNKELNLYQTLIKEKFDSEAKSMSFVDAIVNARHKLNNSLLNRGKYNLIKEVKDKFEIESFFNSRVNNYKVLASIYKLFEYAEADNPTDLIKAKYALVKHITKKPQKEEIHSNKISESFNFSEQDKDLRLLSYRILVNRFNERYSGKLDIKQRNLLKEYINNVSNTENLKEYVNKEIKLIKSKLQKYTSQIDDKVVKIKLNEVILLVDNILNERIIKDSHVISLLRHYELLKELKKVQK